MTLTLAINCFRELNLTVRKLFIILTVLDSCILTLVTVKLLHTLTMNCLRQADC